MFKVINLLFNQEVNLVTCANLALFFFFFGLYFDHLLAPPFFQVGLGGTIWNRNNFSQETAEKDSELLVPPPHLPTFCLSQEANLKWSSWIPEPAWKIHLASLDQLDPK